MATAVTPPPLPDNRANPARPLSLMHGVLSYLVPGLGQVVQGRIAKGVLFFVCVYTLFFYGMFLGTASATIDGTTYTLHGSVYIPQLEQPSPPSSLPTFVQTLYKNRPQFAGQFWVGIVVWPAIAQYWDCGKNQMPAAQDDNGQHPNFGRYQREPTAAALNAIHNTSDKRLELGWVYTVIAGVLNILVIYDAMAGPVFATNPDQNEGGVVAWIISLFSRSH